MSRFNDDRYYDDVFVFKDLVYAMEYRLGVTQLYRNRNNSLIKLHDIRFPCGCIGSLIPHSLIVRNDHIIQCCPHDKPVSILDRSGELLRTIPIADILHDHPFVCQVDFDGNFLIADSFTNRLLIAHVNQPSSQWRVVNLPDLPDGVWCCGAVWFRHRLYVADWHGRLITFTPVDKPSS